MSFQFFFSNRVVLQVSSDSDTISLRIFGGNRLNSAGIATEFITISKITLDHAARKLRNQLRSVKNLPNAARIGHELTEIRD